MRSAAILLLLLAAAPLRAQFERFPLPEQRPYEWLHFGADGMAWATAMTGEQARLDAAGNATIVLPALPMGLLSDVAVDAQGHLWIASADGLRRRDTITNAVELFPVGAIRVVEPGSGNDLWLLRGNDVVRFDRQTHATSTFPLGGIGYEALYAHGALWVQRGVGGQVSLVRVDGNGDMTVYPLGLTITPPQGETGVPVRNALAPATNGRIWIFTWEGLRRFTPATGMLEAASTALVQPRTYAVAPDGAVWVPHHEGLARLTDSTITNWPVPTREPGFCFYPYHRPAAAFAPDGRLWYIDRYNNFPIVILCPPPPVPYATVMRVDTAALGPGETHVFGHSDIPTLSQWMLVALASLMGIAALRMLRN